MPQYINESAVNKLMAELAALQDRTELSDILNADFPASLGKPKLVPSTFLKKITGIVLQSENDLDVQGAILHRYGSNTLIADYKVKLIPGRSEYAVTGEVLVSVVGFKIPFSAADALLLNMPKHSLVDWLEQYWSNQKS